jgi:hypothetical protein
MKLVSGFRCDLSGAQKLQIWFAGINLFYQSSEAPYPVYPTQAKAIVDLFNSSVANWDGVVYYVAFPYSPYLEKEMWGDWIRNP